MLLSASRTALRGFAGRRSLLKNLHENGTIHRKSDEKTRQKAEILNMKARAKDRLCEEVPLESLAETTARPSEYFTAHQQINGDLAAKPSELVDAGEFYSDKDLLLDLVQHVVPELSTSEKLDLSVVTESINKSQHYLSASFSYMYIQPYSNIVSHMVVIEEHSSRRRQVIFELLHARYGGYIRKQSAQPLLSEKSMTKKSFESSSEWSLVDFKTFFVHLVSPTTRESLDLEGLWTKEIPSALNIDEHDKQLEFEDNDPDEEKSARVTNENDKAAERMDQGMIF